MTRDDFLPYVLPELPGCPVPLVMAKAMEVLLDFCERSGVWVQALDPIDLRAGTAEYSLDAPFGSRVVSIESATCGTRPVHPKTRAELNRALPGWQSHEGSPIHFIFTPGQDLLVYPRPNADGQQLLLDVKLLPSAPLNMLPDAVMVRHTLAISAGVKARLMAMKDRSWSAPEMVGYYTGEYERLLSDACVQRLTGGGSRSLFVEPQPFGGVSTGGYDS